MNAGNTMKCKTWNKENQNKKGQLKANIEELR